VNPSCTIQATSSLWNSINMQIPKQMTYVLGCTCVGNKIVLKVMDSPCLWRGEIFGKRI
jgi:hypothetical protein